MLPLSSCEVGNFCLTIGDGSSPPPWLFSYEVSNVGGDNLHRVWWWDQIGQGFKPRGKWSGLREKGDNSKYTTDLDSNTAVFFCAPKHVMFKPGSLLSSVALQAIKRALDN